MSRLIGKLRREVLGISPEEVTFARRGFRGNDEMVRRRLERIGTTFLEGYHAALEADDNLSLGLRLNDVEAEWRGFAFEGAAMSLSLLDFMTPWKAERFQSFIRGPGDAHIYMSYVGAGWALARLPVRPQRSLKRFDPVLCWLAIDGYGFHEGYFGGPTYFNSQRRRGRLAGYAARAFDQGLGRSLWFVEGADIEAITATVSSFDESRRADLWRGVGLACAYAGGQGGATLQALRAMASAFWPNLAQGACFAAKARQRADNMAAHTELACQVFCGMSAESAAQITDVTLRGLPAEGTTPAYEVWRQRIEASFTREVSVK
ncbi:MAG TPA: DUF1702 family protein [Blastocatellia bacterium]|nr:DUF1702 family protein [Blastocatellia bacterium]